jgi:hypothetical protein
MGAWKIAAAPKICGPGNPCQPENRDDELSALDKPESVARGFKRLA